MKLYQNFELLTYPEWGEGIQIEFSKNGNFSIVRGVFKQKRSGAFLPKYPPPLEDFFGTYQGGYLAQFQFKKNDFNSMFSGMNFIRKVKSWACFYNLVF